MVQKAYVLMEYRGDEIFFVVIARSYEDAAFAVGGTIREEKNGKVVFFPKKLEYLKPVDPADPNWRDRPPETRQKWQVFDNGVIRFVMHVDDELVVTIDSYPVIIICIYSDILFILARAFLR